MVFLPTEFWVVVEFPTDGNHVIGHAVVDGSWHDVPSLDGSCDAWNVATVRWQSHFDCDRPVEGWR